MMNARPRTRNCRAATHRSPLSPPGRGAGVRGMSLGSGPAPAISHWSRLCRSLSPRRPARRAAAALALALAALLAQPAPAREAPLVGADPVIEHHMMELAATLRCLQCQNQTLADSNAPLAVDLRDQIRTLLKGGASDDKVREYLVARYGDFVLYDPPLKGSTLLLWFGPLLLLVCGFAALYRAQLRRRAAPDDPPLSEADDQRAQQLLGAPHQDPRP